MSSFKYDVSVIIPVYNTEDFIEECIESIMHQKMDKNRIQVLLINDGSTDQSDVVCKKLQKKYHNIEYIYKSNSGVSDTRNIGINKAEGKYIMLLDSDDYISKYTIKRLIRFFDKHYDEIDLVTYPIYWDREGSISLHSRYSEKNYDKGTGIYFLDEYPHLNQSTVNIIFKNEFENNPLYDTTMKLSEDQNFNTGLLMKKNKIGYVKHAKYFYRRHGSSVSQTRNNPYYCFEDIMSYNENLLYRFSKNGKAPKYIQTLVINTLGWRVKQDELLPYHYSDDKLIQAKNRIKNILNQIDNDVIIQHSNFDIFVKMYFLRWKDVKIQSVLSSKQFSIGCTQNNSFYEDNEINCYLYRTKCENNKMQLFASFCDPILEMFPIEKYIVRGKKKNGGHFQQECEINNIVPFRNTKMPTAHAYCFTYTFDPNEIKSFSFYICVNNYEYQIRINYIKYCGFIKKYRKNSINLDNYRLSYHYVFKKYFSVSKKNYLVNFINEIKSIPFYPFKNVLGILAYRRKIDTSRNIWLYSDSPGVIDNAFYQFIHDFNKNDGVERYYIVYGDTSYLDNKLTLEQKKYLIKHKSKEHKELFLKSNKLLISFSSITIYSPFKNLKWYVDKLHYELVYLQHGILHASLQRMYAKEYTQIDKFVISSNFEKNNLIKNYNYMPNDLVLSGMPRFGMEHNISTAKNKILFAPSWRQYLIGYLVDNKRMLKDEEFLNSIYFKEIYHFLHSQKLQEILEKKGLELNFQLHPIFKPYTKHFNMDDVNYVSINFEKVDLSEYNLFITDFSSYQFDFVKLVRPIVYFLPDEKEFKAGLHSYKDLDLKYEDAFGKLCLDSHTLLDEVENIVNHHFEVEEPFKSRMENFFVIDNDPCEKIYNSIKKD